MSTPPPSEHARLVRRARADLGSITAIADLLGVSRDDVRARLDGRAGLDPGQLRVLRELDRLNERLRTVPPGRMPAGWFRSPCAALDGATPEDVLVVDGARRLLDAIDDGSAW
jgi:Protein of unknown function (DUF2384)